MCRSPQHNADKSLCKAAGTIDDTSLDSFFPTCDHAMSFLAEHSGKMRCLKLLLSSMLGLDNANSEKGLCKAIFSVICVQAQQLKQAYIASSQLPLRFQQSILAR